MQLFVLCPLLVFTMAIPKSFAVGVAAGGELNLANGILPAPIADHIFLGADVFSNYYNNGTIDYNYGAKATLGYKVMGAQIFGLYGLQHSNFNHKASANFKESSSALYGFGFGYNFPLNIGVRLNQTYFNLEQNNGQDKRFPFTDLMLVLVF